MPISRVKDFTPRETALLWPHCVKRQGRYVLSPGLASLYRGSAGKMLPKMGKVLHKSGNGAGGGGPEAAYARLIADALNKELGGSHRAIKQLMRWTGASERTAKNWLAGTCGPSGAHLITIIAQSDEVLECILIEAGRQCALAADEILLARNKLVVVLSQLDDILERRLDQ